jgi:hypothetical protein
MAMCDSSRSEKNGESDPVSRPSSWRFGTSSPNCPNTWPKIIAVATGMTTNGTSTLIRQKVRTRRFWSSTAAISSARTSCGTAPHRKIENVFSSDRQNSGCRSTQVKLSIPTKSPMPARRCQSCSATTTLNRSGNAPNTANSRKNGDT